MLEESDHVSCVTLLADVDDGFGGLAVQIMEYLSDELRRTERVKFGTYIINIYNKVILRCIVASMDISWCKHARWS